MKKRFTFLFVPVFLFCYVTMNGQYNLAWSAYVNGNADTTEFCESLYPNVLQLTDSGYLYSASNSIIGGEQDILIYKCANSGTPIWTVQYDNGSQTADMVTSITVDPNGNLLVLGNKKLSSTDWDIQLIQFNPNGVVNWVYSFSSVVGGGIDLASEVICEVDSNNILICGLTSLTNYSYAVIKLSAQGQFINSYSFNGGTGNYGYPNHIELDSIGNIYMTGQYKNIADNSDDGLIVKLDSSLNQLWYRTYGGPNGGGDYYYDLAIDNSGNPVVVGNESQGTVNEKFLIIKYDSSGNIAWQDNYSDTYIQSGTFRAIKSGQMGELYVVGESDSVGVQRMTTIKYLPNGVVAWQRSFCGVGMVSATANSIDCNSGKVVSCGYSVSPTHGIITVYDTLGNEVWLYESSSTVSDDAYYSGRMDTIGNIYVIGTNNAFGTQDMWIQKFSVDLLGTSEIEQVTSVFPNPTSNTVNLSTAVSQYSVFDLLGNEVISVGEGYYTQVDLGTLPTGVYFIRLGYSDNIVKVVKE